MDYSFYTALLVGWLMLVLLSATTADPCGSGHLTIPGSSAELLDGPECISGWGTGSFAIVQMMTDETIHNTKRGGRILPMLFFENIYEPSSGNCSASKATALFGNAGNRRLAPDYWVLCPNIRNAEDQGQQFRGGVTYFNHTTDNPSFPNQSVRYDFRLTLCPDTNLTEHKTETYEIFDRWEQGQIVSSYERFHMLLRRPDGISRSNLIVDVVPWNSPVDLTIAFGPCNMTQEPKFTRFNIDSATAPLEIRHECLPENDDILYLGVRRSASCGTRCYCRDDKRHCFANNKYNITVQWNGDDNGGQKGNCLYHCDHVLDGSQPNVNRNGGCSLVASDANHHIVARLVFSALLVSAAFLFLY